MQPFLQQKYQTCYSPWYTEFAAISRTKIYHQKYPTNNCPEFPKISNSNLTFTTKQSTVRQFPCNTFPASRPGKKAHPNPSDILYPGYQLRLSGLHEPSIPPLPSVPRTFARFITWLIARAQCRSFNWHSSCTDTLQTWWKVILHMMRCFRWTTRWSRSRCKR